MASTSHTTLLPKWEPKLGETRLITLQRNGVDLLLKKSVQSSFGEYRICTAANVVNIKYSPGPGVQPSIDPGTLFLFYCLCLFLTSH